MEMGFLHVAQAGLEILTSGDLCASASQSAGIIGMGYCTWLNPSVFILVLHMVWGGFKELILVNGTWNVVSVH